MQFLPTASGQRVSEIDASKNYTSSWLPCDGFAEISTGVFCDKGYQINIEYSLDGINVATELTKSLVVAVSTYGELRSILKARYARVRVNVPTGTSTTLILNTFFFDQVGNNVTNAPGAGEVVLNPLNEVKRLVAGTNVSFTVTSDNITIDSTAGAGATGATGSHPAMNVFNARGAGSTTILISTAVTGTAAPYTVEHINTDPTLFTFSATGSVMVNRDITAWLTYDLGALVPAAGSTGTNDTFFYGFVNVNGVKIDTSYVSGGTCSFTDNPGISGARTIVLSLTAGDVVDVRAVRNNANILVSYLPLACGVSIMEIV